MCKRKLTVVFVVAGVFLLAHWARVNCFVVENHFDMAARWVRAEFLTGTAITILLALVFLLPKREERW